MINEVLTPPTREPVSISRAREHLRVVDTCEDSLIETKIAAARDYVENYTQRKLVTQTHRMTLEEWPTALLLQASPVQSVTSITYTIDSIPTLFTDWVLRKSNPLSVICPTEPWPTIDDHSEITIDYVVGYGNPQDVPDGLTAALELVLADLFEIRESQSFGVINENETAKNLMHQYRVESF